jgi:hypothetical protein
MGSHGNKLVKLMKIKTLVTHLMTQGIVGVVGKIEPLVLVWAIGPSAAGTNSLDSRKLRSCKLSKKIVEGCLRQMVTHLE